MTVPAEPPVDHTAQVEQPFGARFRPAVVVASVCLWLAYIAVDTVLGIAIFPSLTPVLAGALVADIVMFILALIILAAQNWARIVLAIIGGIRMIFVSFALMSGFSNAVFFILSLLLTAAFVTMFMPTANAWFAAGDQAGQRPASLPGNAERSPAIMAATEPATQPTEPPPVPHVPPSEIPPPSPGRYRPGYGLRRPDDLIPVQPTEPPSPGSSLGHVHPATFAADAQAALIPVTPAHTAAVKETTGPSITTAPGAVSATPAADQVPPTTYPLTVPGVRAEGRDRCEFDEKIANVRRDKESAIDAHDFALAAHLRDREKQLLAQKNETLIAAPHVTSSHRRPWAKPVAAVSVIVVVVGTVLLVGFLHTSGITEPIIPADLAAPYHSPDGYSISPPAGWSARPYPSVSVAYVAPTAENAGQKPFLDNLNVLITPNTQTLGSTISQTKQQYPSFATDYTVRTDQPTTLPSGQTAYLLGGTFDSPNGGQLENIQLVLVNAGKQYTVTFTSSAGDFDNNYDLAQAALSSFTLK